MFPNGVIYEGVSEQPLFHRGESGANDSIVPSMDNLLELTVKMPQNPLTEILMDFRKYRPKNHNDYLRYVYDEARRTGIRSLCGRDPKCSLLYLLLLDQIREFRSRHWNFTKEYIIKHTSHPVATGGSPIVTWLPNQLAVVLDQTIEFGKLMQGDKKPEVDQIINRAILQRNILDREVSHLSKVIAN